MKRIYVLENEEWFKKEYENTYLWYGYNETINFKSILKRIDSDSHNLRFKILQLLSFSNIKISSNCSEKNVKLGLLQLIHITDIAFRGKLLCDERTTS